MNETGPVSTVATLKALADPTRLKLLSALMRKRAGELPAMSVKELAAELGEPQTKLYRHVKQLEAAGLIKSVSSRVVSGIVEQRYQACQGDLSLGHDLTAAEKVSPALESTIATALELYRTRLFSAGRSGQLDLSSQPAPHRRTLLALNETEVPVATAAAIYDRLAEIAALVDKADQPGEGSETTTINVLIGYFAS